MDYEISDEGKLKNATHAFNKGIEHAREDLTTYKDMDDSCYGAHKGLLQAQFQRGKAEAICESGDFQKIKTVQEDGETYVELGPCEQLKDDMEEKFNETNRRFEADCQGAKGPKQRVNPEKWPDIDKSYNNTCGNR